MASKFVNINDVSDTLKISQNYIASIYEVRGKQAKGMPKEDRKDCEARFLNELMVGFRGRVIERALKPSLN